MKFENISEFFLIILVGITEYCDALFSLNSLISVGSLTFSIIGSKSEYWEMLRFFTILPNELLKTSAVSFSVFTISSCSLKLILSRALNFSESEGFTVF